MFGCTWKCGFCIQKKFAFICGGNWLYYNRGRWHGDPSSSPVDENLSRDTGPHFLFSIYKFINSLYIKSSIFLVDRENKMSQNFGKVLLQKGIEKWSVL